MNSIHHFFYNKFLELGTTENAAKYLNMFTLLILTLVVVFLIDVFIRKMLRGISARIAKSTKTNFDDLLITNKVPRNIAHIIPVLIFIAFIPLIFDDFDKLKEIVTKVVQIFSIVLAIQIARSVLNSVKDYLKELPRFKDKPIASYIQVFMIFAWMAGIFMIIAIITGKTFLEFLGALGAVSAIIILIFRDTILGFVASIQVSVNDMVRIGDWVTFEKFGADGDVIEITLATVKVKNFDQTITTIPTYALISDSFKNWRGMTSTPGRRIKRAMYIKMDSIKYLVATDVEKLKKVQLITEYLNTMQEKINTYNAEHEIDKTLLINGNNLTNIGVFRKYAQTYVQNHSGILDDMMIMVRQLAPTTQGLPLEIYAFSADKRWENYEYIMADIFDHLLAAIKYFDLELFELPTNTSFKPNHLAN